MTKALERDYDGIIIGAGIYVLLGPATALAGGTVWLSFLLAARLQRKTPIILGILAATLLDYKDLFNAGALAGYMRPLDSPWIAAGPALQVVRRRAVQLPPFLIRIGHELAIDRLLRREGLIKHARGYVERLLTFLRHHIKRTDSNLDLDDVLHAI